MLKRINVFLYILLTMSVLVGCKKEKTDPSDETSSSKCTVWKFNTNEDGTNYATYEYNSNGDVIRINAIELILSGGKIVDSTFFEYDVYNRVNKVLSYRPDVMIEQEFSYATNGMLSQQIIKKNVVGIATTVKDSSIYERTPEGNINITNYNTIVEGGITYYDTIYYKQELDGEGNVLRLFAKGGFLYPKDIFVLVNEVQYGDKVPANLKVIAGAFNISLSMDASLFFLFGETKMIKELKTYFYGGAAEPIEEDIENFNYIYDTNGNITGIGTDHNLFVYRCE